VRSTSAEPEEEVEEISSTSSMPLSASSTGTVTSCSTDSGEAPAYGTTTPTAGNCRLGISSIFSDPSERKPKIATRTVARATKARLRRENEARWPTGALLCSVGRDGYRN
jgi:hypothetical protein